MNCITVEAKLELLTVVPEGSKTMLEVNENSYREKAQNVWEIDKVDLILNLV